jgi:hypothetical protein
MLLVLLGGLLAAVPRQVAVGAPAAGAEPAGAAPIPVVQPAPTPAPPANPEVHLALPAQSSSSLICRSGGSTIVGYKSDPAAAFIVTVDPYVVPMPSGSSPSTLSPGQCGYLTFRGSKPQYHSLCFKTGSVSGFRWFPAAPSFNELVTNPAIVGGLMSASGGVYSLRVHAEQSCLVVDAWAQ